MIIQEYVDTLINTKRYELICEGNNNSNYKINGVNINYEKKDDEEYIKKSCKIIIKEYKNICREAAKRILDYYKRSGNSKILEKYSIENLADKLILYNIDFCVFRENKNHNDLANYSMTFDTNPRIDKYHTFTLYVIIDMKTKDIKYNSVYDG